MDTNISVQTTRMVLAGPLIGCTGGKLTVQTSTMTTNERKSVCNLTVAAHEHPLFVLRHHLVNFSDCKISAKYGLSQQLTWLRQFVHFFASVPSFQFLFHLQLGSPVGKQKRTLHSPLSFYSQHQRTLVSAQRAPRKD